jgi:3-phenylpropionate/trans-cinnamate dioxygenase ferredoxin subunit
MPRYVVARQSEIPVGGRKLFKVRGREIVVFNVKGEFSAFLNRCPHKGAELCFGVIVGLVESDARGEYRYSRAGEMLRCPYHGWEFDLKTGQSYCEPDSVKARQYNVAVEDGETLAKGPFVAETFKVTVEDSYVVLEV